MVIMGVKGHGEEPGGREGRGRGREDKIPTKKTHNDKDTQHTDLNIIIHKTEKN